MEPATPGVDPSARSGWRTWLSGGLGPPLALFLGSFLLVVASVLPIWIMSLRAPQYPDGLWLMAFGGKVAGDLQEINGLNHYIGMQTIDPTLIPEMILWAPTIIALTFALAMALFLRNWLGLLALIGLWVAPVGVLADIQRWLFVFGQNLDPTAALTLDPFIPWVLGPTEVKNFDIWAFPGPALILMFTVAVIGTVGRRLPLPSRTAQLASTLAATGLVSLAVILFTVPALESEVAPGHGGAPPVAGSMDLVAAVANAPAGATLVVPAGTYRVNLDIDRPLTLVAEGEVVLDGGGRGTVVTITSPDVTVRGFHIRGSGGQIEESAGVKVLADRATVAENTFEQVYVGVSVQGASDADIVDNRITGLGQVIAGAEHADAAVPETSPPSAPDPDDPHADHAPGAGPGAQAEGISLWNASRVLIRGNDISGVRDAVYLAYGTDVMIDTNRFTSSRYAVHSMVGTTVVIFGNTALGNVSGFVVMNSSDVTIGRNTVTDSRSPATGYGIMLKDVRDITVRENVLARNQVGLKAEGAMSESEDEAMVYANRFAANRVGIALFATADLAFGANAFDANLTQVLALDAGVGRQNVWSYRGAGNAWSDYAGYDVNGDGIGDVPHLSGGAEAVLLASSPSLELLITSPAFDLLSASQSWWSANFDPVVIDTVPLTSAETAPPVTSPRAADTPAAWVIFGGLLVVGTIGAAVRIRGTRRAA
jgi:nitrous oxidase accessory protein